MECNGRASGWGCHSLARAWHTRGSAPGVWAVARLPGCLEALLPVELAVWLMSMCYCPHLQHELREAQSSSKAVIGPHPAAQVLAGLSASPAAAAAAAASTGALWLQSADRMLPVCMAGPHASDTTCQSCRICLSHRICRLGLTLPPAPLACAGAGVPDGPPLSPEQIQAAMDHSSSGAALAAAGGLSAAGAAPAALSAEMAAQMALLQQQIAATIAAGPLVVSPEQLQEMAAAQAAGGPLQLAQPGSSEQQEQQAEQMEPSAAAAAAGEAAGADQAQQEAILSTAALLSPAVGPLPSHAVPGPQPPGPALEAAAMPGALPGAAAGPEPLPAGADEPPADLEVEVPPALAEMEVPAALAEMEVPAALADVPSSLSAAAADEL